MNIGIDIDNTITETSLLANYLVKNDNRYDENQDYHNLSKADLMDFLTRYLEEIVYNVKLKPHVTTVLNKWHKLGYKIIFITARGAEKTDGLVNLKTLCLTSMYFEKMNIPFDEIVFFKDSKEGAALDYKLDIFIDDKEQVLNEMKKANVKTLRMVENDKSNHIVVKNWFEIEKIIAEMGDK